LSAGGGRSVDVEGEYLLISKFSRRNCKRKIKGLYANATPDLIGNYIRRQLGIPILIQRCSAHIQEDIARDCLYRSAVRHSQDPTWEAEQNLAACRPLRILSDYIDPFSELQSESNQMAFEYAKNRVVLNGDFDIVTHSEQAQFMSIGRWHDSSPGFEVSWLMVELLVTR